MSIYSQYINFITMLLIGLGCISVLFLIAARLSKNSVHELSSNELILLEVAALIMLVSGVVLMLLQLND